MNSLPSDFYERDTVEVARDLLGKKLVRIINGHRIIGIISETEAYTADDPASHSYRGKTLRNNSMFGPVGHAYVYLSYGLHYCLNIVARASDIVSGAVLIRAMIPVEGLEYIRSKRGLVSEKLWTNGPGKVCQALSITKELDGSDITSSSDLFVLDSPKIKNSCVKITSRIGISQGKEQLWRFIINN